MCKIVLITGGSRSGKSEYAEKILKQNEDVLYIATSIITDEEMKERVEKHKIMRNKNWTTYEGFRKIDAQIKNYEGKNVMIDSVTTMITNIMFEKEVDFENIAEEKIKSILEDVEKEFESMIFVARKENKNLVMVTDEVGSGLIPEYKLGRIFRDLLGSLNQYIAALSDELYFVCCGIPLKVK